LLVIRFRAFAGPRIFATDHLIRAGRRVSCPPIKPVILSAPDPELAEGEGESKNLLLEVLPVSTSISWKPVFP